MTDVAIDALRESSAALDAALARTPSMADSIERMQTENERYREALTQILFNDEDNADEMRRTAEKALGLVV